MSEYMLHYSRVCGDDRLGELCNSSTKGSLGRAVSNELNPNTNSSQTNVNVSECIVNNVEETTKL